MSIQPVEGFPPPNSSDPADPNLSSGRVVEPGTGEKPAQPVSGTSPKEENSAAQKVDSTYQLPRDVVEVHQDPEIKSQIIVDYLDKSKNVVLQVPSNEELSVERGIARELETAVRLRHSASTAVTGSEGGKTHGD